MKTSIALGLLSLSCVLLSAAEPAKTRGIFPEIAPVPKPVPAVSADAIHASMRRGVAFLLKDQNKNGSWGSAERTKDLNIFAPIPGAHHAFRTAVTSMCISALIEAGDDSPEVRQAIEKGEHWLFENLPRLRRADPVAIYNVWGHGYAIQALLRMRTRKPEDKERRDKIDTLMNEQFDKLSRYESVDGGWGYYDFDVGAKQPAASSTSFVNATVLVAFAEAKAAGFYPPERVVKRAIDATVRQRKSDFSYLYGEYLKYQPMRGINRPGGSSGRSQACNIALRLWGDAKVTDEVLKNWLNRLFSRNLWLDIGRKRPVPHEAHFQIAGYFFYFGHYYAALCIEQLKPADRPMYQDQLATVLLKLQEKDGSWWDYPLYNYHQQYGTAFVLMSLKRCSKAEKQSRR